jgi:SAM-dependent methyltransferase
MTVTQAMKIGRCGARSHAAPQVTTVTRRSVRLGASMARPRTGNMCARRTAILRQALTTDGTSLVDERRDAEYVLGRSQHEYERLIEQGRVLGPATERVLRGAGIADGMRVLDVGCGVGEVARVVHELVGDSGEIVGVDVDASAVALAEQRVREMGANFTVVVGDICSIDVGADFDVACCRMVLQYLPNATDAISAMASHVKAGGVVVAHEIGPSLGSFAAYPAFPLFDQVRAWIGAAWIDSGGNPFVGVELGRRFAEAGLEPVDQPIVETACALGDSAVAARRFRMLIESLLPVLIERDVVSEHDVDFATFEERFRREARTVNSTVVLWPPLVGWWARRP